MKSKEDILHKARYLATLRENEFWKNRSNKYTWNEIEEMYLKFVNDFPKETEDYINSSLNSIKSEKGKEIIQSYYGLFKEKETLKKISERLDEERCFIKQRKKDTIYTLRLKLTKINKKLLNKTKNLENLLKNYEIKMEEKHEKEVYNF